MKGWIEIPIFAGLAMGIHVALFATKQAPGSEAGGVGGDSVVSVTAASVAVIEMVETWQRPPNPQPVLITVLPAPEAAKNPAPRPVRLEQTPRAEVPVAPMEPANVQKIKIDATLVAMPTQRPKSRPDVKLRPKTTPAPKPKTVTEPATQPKAKENSISRNAQVSAGTGGNVEAGNSGQSRVATATKGNQDKLRAVWGSRIRSKIERNKRYPRGSNNSGKVILTLTVSRDGRLQDVRVAKSSGNPTLDQTALLIVKKAGPFTKAPKKLPGNSFRFNLPIKLTR